MDYLAAKRAPRPTDLDDARANRVVERREDYLDSNLMRFIEEEEAAEVAERSAGEVLALVRALHVEWGDTEDPDPVVLWERLGRILGGESG